MASNTRATVYVDRAGSFRIVPTDLTPAGVGIARSSGVDLVLMPSDEELGLRVLDALHTAGRVVAHPASQAEWSTATRSFLRAMGYRSHRALMSANAAVFVSRDGDSVQVVGADNLGTRGGYAQRSDGARVVVARAADLGHAIREVAAQATFADAD